MIPRSSKILADENIQGEVIEFLRNQGFDVLAAKEALPEGTSDAEILVRAVRENRILFLPMTAILVRLLLPTSNKYLLFFMCVRDIFKPLLLFKRFNPCFLYPKIPR